MELRQLEYFIAVAELLSFSQAAERCCVVQPTISHQIANLEEELGLQLFERNRRSINLTGAGELMLSEARLLVAKKDDILSKMEALRNGAGQTLRVGYYSACLDPVFGAKIYGFARENGIQVRFEHLDFYKGVFFDKLLDGEFNLVITLADAYQVFDNDGSILYEPIYYVPVRPVVRKSHPLAGQNAPLSREQLLELCTRVLIYAPSYSKSVCRRGILWNSAAFGLPEERFEVARSTLEMQLEIEAGNAVGLMLETELRSLNAEGRLAALNVENAPSHEVGVAFSAKGKNALLRTFIDYIRTA